MEMTQAPPEPQVPTLDTGEGYEDYWGVSETRRYTLPDGKQWIEFKIMDEGDKTKFQKMTNSDLIVQRSGDSRIKIDPARERHELIKSSVTNWNLMQKHPDGEWHPAPFAGNRSIEQWLEKAPPKIVEDLELEIRKANPWMQADMSVDEIDKEIERLNDLRKLARERELGEGASTTK